MYIDRIKTKNKKAVIRKRIMPYIQRLKGQDYVEGVVLLGGLSNTPNRNFMDKFSDVDMAIFIKGSRSQFNGIDKLPDFEFHIPLDHELLEVNVHQQFMEDEKEAFWDEGKKEAYTYTSEIIYDESGRVKELIDHKVAFDEKYRSLRLSIILSQYYWLVNINPLRQVERGYILNGMDLLNTGLDLLIEGIYLYNRRYRPHPKWRIEIAKDLAWTPTDFVENLKDAFTVSAINQKEILRRREVLTSMFSKLEAKVKEDKLFGELSPYEYACLYGYEDRQIAESSYVVRHFGNLLEKLDQEEIVLLNGLANEYFLQNKKDLYLMKETDLPGEYRKLIDKIGRTDHA